MVDLSINVFGVEFQNPVTLASGTCGYGEEYADLIAVDELGGIFTKAVTLEARRLDDGRIEVIVANVDQIVPMVAAAKPKPRWHLLDRYLVGAEAADVPALICVTKMDLADGPELEIGVIDSRVVQGVVAQHPKRLGEPSKHRVDCERGPVVPGGHARPLSAS